MLVPGGSRKFLGIGRCSQGRRRERSLTSAAREVGGGIGWLFKIRTSLGVWKGRSQPMKPAMLVLQFGQAQAVLQTKRDLQSPQINPLAKSVPDRNQVCNFLRWQFYSSVPASGTRPNHRPTTVVAKFGLSPSFLFTRDVLTWAISILRIVFSAEPGCGRVMVGNDEEEENLTETQFAGWQGKGGKGSQLGDR